MAAKPVVAQDVDRKMIAMANGIVEVAFTLPAPFLLAWTLLLLAPHNDVDLKRLCLGVPWMSYF
ncbi:hypothetical protein [Xanthomonas sp. LF04-12]|uniref:hypothetical protein n=1 Tax=Xanthomonas sp. LF04-12 TaxID=3097552 RepID=UPI002A7F9D38|nr:hypothetical protein [Xanthomonas sp. LF04-12]MDY4356623.1 hypothetical protein [Xanthomonas sp. LF04-12]